MVTMASCHAYTAIRARVPTMTTEFTIQATPPYWANRAMVSMSLVTREVSSPRRVASWSAIGSWWTWVNARTRRLRSMASAAFTRRT